MTVTINPKAKAQIDQAMHQVITDIVEAVADEATQIVPVRTGFLKSTIHAIPPASPDGRAFVRATASYAYWVEQRRPFLYPAMHEVLASVGALIRHR